MEWSLYIRHKLTAHHLRDRLKKNKKTQIALCKCGWVDPLFRKDYKRLIKCFITGGHAWEKDDEPAEVGKIYHDGNEYRSTIDDGDGIVVGRFRQCTKCYKTEYIK